MSDIAAPLAIATSIIVVLLMAFVMIQGEGRHRDRRRHTQAGERPVAGKHDVADRPADAGAEPMNVVSPGTVTPSEHHEEIDQTSGS